MRMEAFNSPGPARSMALTTRELEQRTSALADFDGDGNQDRVSVNADAISLWFGSGNGKFLPSAQHP